jgi:hypothetical protein
VVSKVRDDTDGELNARLQLAALPTTPYREISDTADRFNFLAANGKLDEEWGQKQVIAERIREVMEGRLAEADSYDLSRLGWICMHLRDVASAHEYARRGLALDPQNHHCERLLRAG